MKNFLIGIKSIITISKEKNKKPILKIIKEFLNVWWIHKEFPIHYFSRFLYRRDFVDYKNFIPTKKYYKLVFSNKIQNPSYAGILQNKLFFGFMCERNLIAAPRLTSYNIDNNFYLDGKKNKIKSNSELVSFFEKVFHSLDLTRVIVKEMDTKGGKGIFVILKKSLQEQIHEIGHLLLSGSFIHQDFINQHPEINKIYKHSINTLRFDICVDNEGSNHLLGSGMRFGADGSLIDNRSQGGLFVPIDDSNGSLLGKGYSQMGFGANEFVKHPTTDFEFKGFKIPCYNEAKRLAMNMSELIPNRIVGWDIAITPNGPIVVEGNHDSNITMTEIPYGGYLKHPVVQQLLKSL